MIVDPTYFQNVFPELASTSAATIEALNGPACLYVSPNVFKESTQYATALIIAHMLTLGSMRGGGPVTSDKIGDLTTSQAALSTATAMQMTSYGMRFLELARMFSFPLLADNGGAGRILPPPFGGYQPTWPEGNTGGM